MKKNVILMGAMIISSLAFSQVGMNTPTPASTLDVTAKNATGTATNVDGLLVPRVDRQRAQAMTAVPNSTLIFVNSIATGTTTGTAINIDATGYYYFEAGVWTKLKAPVTQFYDWLKTGDAQPNVLGDNSVNIYHMGGNVGIGTNTPVGRLHVYNPTNGAEIGNDYVFDDESPIGQVQGLVLRRSNAGANLAQNDFMGSVSFNPKTNGGFSYGGAGIAGIYRGNGTNILTALAFRINNNQEAARIDENGNMGIGTSTPTTKLEINNGTTAGAIKIVDGTQGNNKVLMSDANGVGKWSSLPGSWFGLLRSGATNTLGQINFTAATIIGQGGTANTTTDAITVPTTGLYEITIGGWTTPLSQANPALYLTTWEVRNNGTPLIRPHYASPNGTLGTDMSVTKYVSLNSGDSVTLFLLNPFSSSQPADKANDVSLAIKLIQ